MNSSAGRENRLRLAFTFVDLIAAIESDTYDKHTSHTFIRGYLRTYAKLVGIPEETILAAYDKLGLTPPTTSTCRAFLVAPVSRPTTAASRSSPGW